MSILYKPRKMVCAIPGKEKTGYFAAKVNNSTVDLEELCYRISNNCTITGADIKGVIEALTQQFELELLNGRSIQFGDIGTFSASITSDVTNNKEDLKPHKVRIKTITYLPSIRLKAALKKEAEFMRLRDFNRKFNGTDEE